MLPDDFDRLIERAEALIPTLESLLGEIYAAGLIQPAPPALQLVQGGAPTVGEAGGGDDVA